MNLQQFFAMSFGLSVENTYYIAIAVLACVLGAEIAGICMLIGKLRRARSGEIDLPDDQHNNNGGANYAIAALSFGAVSATAELVLLVLAIAAAVGAFVLFLLLAILYAKGYLLISAKAEREAAELAAKRQAEEAARRAAQEAAAEAARRAAQEAAEQAARKAAQEVAEQAAKKAAQESAAREAEQLEQKFGGVYANDVAAQQAVSNLIATENAVLSEEVVEQAVPVVVEEPVEEVIEQAVPVVVEEPVEEVIEEPVAEVVEAPITEVVQEPAAVAAETAVVAQKVGAAPAVQQPVGHTVVGESVPVYARQVPVIEKHIIETTKEIIKETNTTTVTEGKSEPQPQPQQLFSPATEEMMKAITEFMKLETQLRMEREVAVERPTQNGESAPTFAEIEGEEFDIEEPDVDEPDNDDEPDTENGAEKNADAEAGDYEYESDLFGNERIVGFDEETGYYIMARYRKSCEAKLIQSRPDTKKYYSAIRNALMGYEGTKERMSWAIDTYTNEHAQVAKINIRPRTLDLYLALDPSTLEDSVYHGKDVSGKKKYAETPFLYKVNSPRKLALALELVQRACEELGLSPIDIEEVNYEEQYPFTNTETLISRGLIREYLHEEKPAVTFELDPDHVPQLAEEDETVIPANANFIWELDDEQPEHKEEPVAEEVVEEAPVLEEIVEEVIEEQPAFEEAPVVEEAPVTQEPAVERPYVAPGTTTTTTTTHETIRTTERHYTERYWGGGRDADIIEKARTIEVLPEPTQEQHIAAATEEIVPTVVDESIVEEAPAQEVVEEVVEEIEGPIEEIVEEVIEEEVIEEEPVEEIIDDEIEEEIEETTEEQAAQIQSAVAALFGDDIFEEDEPIEEEIVEEVVEEVVEEPVEEIIEEVVEEVVEEPVEEIIEEVIEEVEAEAEEEIIEEEVNNEELEEVYEDEEVVEEESEAEAEEVYEEVYEEVVEEDPEAEEEEYYEEVYEEVVEEEPETEEEEYYEEVYEEVVEEEPETEEEEYYEEVYDEEPEEVYDDEEYYEEVVEEVVEEEEEEEEEEEAVAEKPAAPLYQASGDVVLLDVCVFDDYFDNGAIVNLETLKQVGLAPENATRLKVYASGELKGQFTIEAHHFTLDAIKAISDADGDSIMIR